MHKHAVKVSVMGICLLLCLALTGRASDRSVTKAVTANKTWQSKSEQGNFIVELIAANGKIKLSEFLDWQLVIRDAISSQGVAPVRIVVGGGMPAHGHGLPTQPQVTEHLGDGRYQLDGLMFNMAGQWQLIFGINTREHADRVVFDLTIDH